MAMTAPSSEVERSNESARRIAILSNQGEVGGGEVMLLALAEAARDLGHEVVVVAPEHPADVVEAAAAQAFQIVAVPGSNARSYARHLRAWARRSGADLLWCNGLRPAFATAGLPKRVVHLHQVPQGMTVIAARLACRGCCATVVPSRYVADRVPGSVVLENWVAPVDTAHSEKRRTLTLGYLGRLSPDKGVDVLVDAVRTLVTDGRDVRLLVAGEARFVAPGAAARIHANIADFGERVEHRGWIDRATFFDAVDLAVFPSVWSEPFGLVAAEAMAARCPFVVSDAGALPEVVGATYPFIARRGDAASLAETIGRALDAEWHDLVEDSYARWQRQYSPEAGRTRLGALIDSLLTKEAAT